MKDFPVIKIEVEHMKQAIAAAFANQQLDYSKEFHLALDRALDPVKIQSKIDEEVSRLVHESIDNAVKNFFWKSEEYKSLIEQEVDNRLMQILQNKRASISKRES